MNKKNTKTPMLISAAAAARLFLKIASMPLSPDIKSDLLTAVSEIIRGQRDLSASEFLCEEGKEIASDLAKAIVRSAKARAAAARRRQEAVERVDEASGNETYSYPEPSPVSSTEVTESENIVCADRPVDEITPFRPNRKKRRGRRRRRGRGQTTVSPA